MNDAGNDGSSDEATARFLVSDEGRRLLEIAAALPGDAPARVLALRKRPDVPPVVAAAVVDVLDARRRARARFPDADRLFFTAATLAQATSPGIAAFHASRLQGFASVADLGCGAGIDGLALAEAGVRVIALERDPARLVFARANAEARGVADRIDFVLGDVTALEWEADAVYWDPARRESGGAGHRVSRHADRYEPPLDFLDALRGRVRGGLLKLSPALPDDVLDDLGGRTLFLSENRECKEACVAFGEAADPDAPVRAAHLLPHGPTLPADPTPAPVAAGPGAFVFDPDPAVLRADALAPLCALLGGGASRLSPDDAYLTGDAAPAHPDARRAASAYRVIETMPYKPRAVGAWLKARGVGRLVVKKRHFPKEPDAVARELGLSGRGGAEATLILARDGGGFLAVVCEPVAYDADL